MDVLADVLATTGFNGVLLAQLRSRGSGWGCALEQQNTAGFHLVAEGTCWLRVEGRPPLQLVSGDVVLLPRGEPHTLAGTPETDAVPYAELEAAHPRAARASSTSEVSGPPCASSAASSPTTATPRSTRSCPPCRP